MVYNLKDISVDLGNGSNFEGEWLFMLDNGEIITFWDLAIEDDEDEQAAINFGWTEEDIKFLKEMSK